MKLQNVICPIVVAVVLCAPVIRAQDQKQDSESPSSVSPLPPMGQTGGGGKGAIAAARGVSAGYGDPQPYDPSQVVPDSNTLSGAELFGLGSLQHAHNVFDPSISVSELGQTTQTGASGQANLGSETIFNGTLNFDRNWSKYQLTTTYNGGGTFYQGPLASNYQFHELTVSQQISWARWHLLLRDDFMATPGAAFTGTGTGGPGLIAESSSQLGSSPNGTTQTFIPNETIQSGNAMRYRDSVLGQAEYSLTRRSTFTISGSYGLLHFTDAGYISSTMVNAQAGYDYLLDPANSVAVLLSYGKIDYAYTNPASSTIDYMASLAYGRKITGRLAFQASGGTQQVYSTGGTGTLKFWMPSASSALSYERRRSGVSFSYLFGLSSGSGVLLGAKSNTFSGAAHYQFTRFWTGTVSGGYAQNNSLVQSAGVTTTFDDWFVGANLSRQMGPHAQINFNYGAQRQISPASCPVIICGGTALQQSFGMTVNWHLRAAE